MIFFKNISLVQYFLFDNVVDRKKSTIYKWGDRKVQVFFKKSNNPYDSFESIYRELIKNELLFELKKGVAKFKSKSGYTKTGYILWWSKLESIIKNSEHIKWNLEAGKLLSINQTCELLNVTRPTLYKLLKNGSLAYVQFMNQKRIQVMDILNFIDLNKNKSSNTTS